eukprot:4542245-Alexandrium_andersonii.AAC.1
MARARTTHTRTDSTAPTGPNTGATQTLRERGAHQCRPRPDEGHRDGATDSASGATLEGHALLLLSCLPHRCCPAPWRRPTRAGPPPSHPQRMHG